MIDFFQQQADARQRTKRLLLLFALAVVALTVLTVICTAFFMPWFAFFFKFSDTITQPTAYHLWIPAILVPTIILAASAYQSWQLSEGGAKLATMMGGRLLNHSSNLREQQLLNVVEEMAVASGMRVPAVYVLDKEPAINAFTAGYDPQDMVIGVTQGCLKMLTRGELQGVIAHEFSHMLNGDTRLNTRMISVLYGIDMIYLIGISLLTITSFLERVPSDSDHLKLNGKPQPQYRYKSGGGHFMQMVRVFGLRGQYRYKGDRGHPLVLLFGMSLVIIGGLGGLFSAMIKAAVCREREYLADAAAVQFTRNPNGIAGALKKIGGYTWHSQMLFANSAMVSHMLFSFDRNPRYEFSTLATHPPLNERITRLEPNWDGQYIQFSAFDLAMMEDESDRPTYDPVKTAQTLGVLVTTTNKFISAADKQPEDLNNLGYAQGALRTAPQDWLACARNADLSCCVMLALLFSSEEEIARVQLERIAQDNRHWAAQSKQLLASRPAVSISSRLPLIEIALPRLAGHISTPEAYDAFKQLMQDLIRADRQVRLFEWCVYAITIGHLKTLCKPVSPPPVLPATTPKAELMDEYRRLFSLVARFSNHGHHPAAAFQAACKRAALPVAMTFDNTARLNDLPRALHRLNRLPPLEKPDLIHALVAIMRHDNYIAPDERELLRAICITLDSPQPPLG
ncbi:MAG: M48 family metallopeptidase [Neisseria sp.]|nr:M48 family metallopeptidase [Neisseria sp.]